MPYHTFTIAWPDRSLSPNGRAHYMVKARHTKAQRREARTEAERSGILGADRAHIHFTFHPKPRGKWPDRDNCIASVKAAQDGIADALRMDDGKISVTYAMSQDRRGCVVVNVLTGDQVETPLQGVIS